MLVVLILKGRSSNQTIKNLWDSRIRHVETKGKVQIIKMEIEDVFSIRRRTPAPPTVGQFRG